MAPRTFYLRDEQHAYSCVLQKQRCHFVTKRTGRCKRKNTRSPMCLQHAQQHLGISVSRDTPYGCGLVATRDFNPGDAIVPYTGNIVHKRIRPSPYIAQTNRTNVFIDAACKRGYGGMANHKTKNNTKLQQYSLRAAHNEGDDPFFVKTTTQKVRRAPRALLGTAFEGYSTVWLVTTKKIKKNEEIFVHYGSQSAYINNTKHHTTGGC